MLAAAVALLSPATVAQGPDPALLPADTAFVVHIDVQRAARLIGVQDLIDELGDSGEEVTDALRQMERRLGFDPLRDIRAVTVFGSDLSGDEPNIMIIADDSWDDAMEALEDQGAVETERHDGMRFQRIYAEGLIRALDIEGANANENDSIVVFSRRVGGGRRAILFGERPEDIAVAARVFEDDELSLAAADRPGLDIRTSNGSIAYLAVGTSLEELMRESPASSLAEKVRGLALELSESQDDINLTLAVATASRQDARDVEALINGLRGLISLAGGEIEDIPDAARSLLEDIRADADGNRVEVQFSMPLRELRQMVEEAIRER